MEFIDYHHYLFREETTGEEFIVGEENEEYAYDLAINIAEELVETWAPGEEFDLHFICELSEEEAEASGLDEY